MFFALSKILNLFLIPFTWVLLVLFACFFVSDKLRKRLLLLSLVSLYLYSTDLLIQPLFKIWECPTIWYKDLENDYDVVVILGGMAAPGKIPDDRTHFPGSPDRLLHAFQLYKLGKAKNIVISGGSGDLVGKRIPEAAYLANVLFLCDMDSSHLFFEAMSRNTRENAIFTKELLQKKIGKNPKILLITSAWHMRRSLGCYEKVGLHSTPFSVDSKIDAATSFWSTLLPNPNSPGKWQVLLHEIIGYAAYSMAGYI